jgi:hypothetical protein
MRITNGSPYYYGSTVMLDDVEIIDFLWADEEAGEVMSVNYGPRDAHGYRPERRKLLRHEREGSPAVVADGKVADRAQDFALFGDLDFLVGILLEIEPAD